MEIHSFVMMGQSNMAGRGELGDVPKISNPRCRMLRNGRWQKMEEPINPDRPIFEGDYHSGVGPAASFAEAYANAYDDVQVGLIPCADGGTSLKDWEPGGLLYDHAVFQTKLAMRTSVVHGILWHQGEAEANDPELYFHYREKFENLFRHFMADTGLAGIPIVMGELGYFLERTTKWGDGIREGYKVLNRTFHEIAESTPTVALATAEGLECKPDEIHFNSASQRIFGRRYFAAYQTIVQPNGR